MDRPRVDDDHRAAPDVEPADGAVLHGLVRWDDWGDGAEPEGLLHDALQVGEVRDVRLFHQPGRADISVDLSPRLAHCFRVRQQQRHCPLGGQRRCVGPGGEEYQDDAFDDSVSVVLGIGILQRQERVNDASLLRVRATGVAPSPLLIDEAGGVRVAPVLQTRQRRVNAAKAVDPS
uniref:Uncharacterized protein n=1 Tax=Arundo donax TaxID=35708 RepID=A0A0A9HNZ7_ARUDO